jgi:hypothetical protein
LGNFSSPQQAVVQVGRKVFGGQVLQQAAALRNVQGLVLQTTHHHMHLLALALLGQLFEGVGA